MAIYKPRWALSLKVPTEAAQGNDGADVVEFTVPVHTFDLVSNNHNEADTLTAVTDLNYAGVDPRILSSAVGTFYLGQADDNGLWSPSDVDLRFVGIMKRSGRHGDGDNGVAVEMLFHDYTTLFLEAKKMPKEGYPELSETLSQAWRRICDNTGAVDANDPSQILPTVKVLRDRIDFVGAARDVVIGDAVPSRFRRLGKRVQTKSPNADAWAVWQQCVGMHGLISFIYLDRCIVTTATDYYTADNPPRLMWGHNIDRFAEDRDTRLAGKGVVITSFDSLTGSVLEGFYPPIGDKSLRRKKISAKKASDPEQVLASEDRVAFAFPGAGTQEAVDGYAKRVYVEMAHQEIEGRIETGELLLERQDGTTVDALQIKAGDSVRIEILPTDAALLGQFKSDEERVDYLVGLRGYTDKVAEIVVKNLRGILSLPPIYLVKAAHTHGDSSTDGGAVNVQITFVNKIQVDGGTDA